MKLTTLIGALFLTLAVVLGSGSPATAQLVFPAGVACANFDLQVDVSGGNQVFREFVDKDGNIVRQLSAGKGTNLLFTNLSTGATFFLKGNGSVTQITFNADGTQTWTITGHNVLILFPTDNPPGPSTTQYVGRVVFTVDLNGVFTLLEVSGRATDICAALSP
jgi:hypothetical protein